VVSLYTSNAWSSILSFVYVSSHKTLFVQDFYKYGPVYYTGHNGSTAMNQVVCELYSSSSTVYTAVSYTCERFFSTSPESAIGPAIYFYIKCSASPAEGLIFECLDLMSDTGFSWFSDSITNTDCCDGCIGEMFVGYTSIVASWTSNIEGGIYQGLSDYSHKGVLFSPEFAVKVSMFSSLVDITFAPFF
jgi:hypothetical protein